MRHSGYKQDQAVAASLNQARESGAKIPKKKKGKKSKIKSKVDKRSDYKKANEAEKMNG